MSNTIDTTRGQFALDVQGLDQLKRNVAKDPEGGIRAAAQQFEALFLQIMLKSMREAIPESSLMNSQQTRFYAGLMDQQWSQHLSGKGLGIAEQLTAQLSSLHANRR